MDNIVVNLFSLVLFIISAAQGGQLLPTKKDGICKTLVETQGYKCEEHQVTTNDGYILSMQRIPVGRSGKAADKPPVLIQHGLFVDAATWVLNPPDSSLAFILADNGFDVWMTNIRGTRYSRRHKTLSTSGMAYWDWSWVELATYDLPATVQHVYNLTGQGMHYIGHSQGTLMVMSALSQNQLLDKLRSAALFSPIAHMNHITTAITKLAADFFVADALYWLGIRQLIPNEDVADQFIKNLCHKLNLDCPNLVSVFTGTNCCLNISMMDIFLDNAPQPTSTRNLIHLSQMIRTGEISKYNFVDPGKNLLHYGQPFPPAFNMANIPNEFPLFMSYGANDKLSDVNDVNILLNDLRNHNKDKLVVQVVPTYGHIDFVLASNAKQILYDPMMDFFLSH